MLPNSDGAAPTNHRLRGASAKYGPPSENLEGDLAPVEPVVGDASRLY